MTDISIGEKIRAGLNECARNRIAVSLILTDRAPFHRVLCWHDEWVDEVEAWIEKPSSTVPEALR